LRDYELVIVISPDVAEEDVPAAIEKINQLVVGRGGEVTQVDHWGRRKLAYPISKHLEGSYVVSQVKLEPGQAATLAAGLRLSEDVLRHLLVRVGD
jgi:small subunit ribosomal protein S6